MRKVLPILIALLIAASSAWPEDSREERLKTRWLQGKKPPISRINVEGASFFDAGRVRKQMYSRPRTLWTALKKDRRAKVQRETLGRDTLEIKYLYYTNGFLGVQVEETFDIDLTDSSAVVNVMISEGRRFVYGEKTLTGGYDTSLHHDLYKLGERLRTLKPVNLLDLHKTVFDMKTIFANNGYPYAEIRYFLDSTSHDSLCNITFSIRGGDLVHYGSVSPSGTKNFPAYTAMRESKIREGRLYRRQDVIDTRRRLLESGYFSTAQVVRSEESTDSLHPEMILRVRERKPLYLTLKTGAGQSQVRDIEWDLSSTFGGRNLFGSRHYDLSARLKFGVGGGRGLLEHVYRVRFTEPWLLGTRTPLTLAAEWEPGVKDPEQNYRIQSWTLSASTVKRFSREIRTGFGVEYESVEIFGVPEDEVQYLKDEQGIEVRRKAYLAFRRDSRDHLFIPSRGSLTDLRTEFYGGFLGGDDHFTKLEASWSSYQIVWPGWISATRFKFGWAQPFSPSKEVPIIDRFYLGGAGSIRGFRVNSLGPHLADSLTGDSTLEKSNFIALFNQEFRWQTLQVFQLPPFTYLPLINDVLGAWPLWQSVFIDIGNGYRKPAEMKLENLAYSYGTGVQLISPAGPIRVDYARRIKTKTIDVDYRWHFSILYAF